VYKTVKKNGNNTPPWRTK